MDFSCSWPYDWMQGDLFFQDCPFCDESSVLVVTEAEKMKLAREGFKTHVVMPCCHEKLTILQIDDDYVWADRPLRK
ncbi:hypothetical protein PU629_05290 [Pullulanibacillus sp. KACC 23026]|uniref:hypothetical protein n=1 Tax=Pullulanibacillus sp. KACC 23026 TaxID=3028315 RepID=UPI0023B13D12|nr:hypothetical protein [Pullulanibacillus sp. KACC 23026]WEG13782.1 hypothetical protein PU629_05290 [Pullulanibacillus sp. KACC 23026]